MSILIKYCKYLNNLIKLGKEGRCFMFESVHQPLLPVRKFISRMMINFLLGLLIILFSLSIGMIGYKYLGHMSWIDAYLNAAMILSGMGPVTDLKDTDAKFFSGTYALFSGIVFLVVIVIMLAPIYHRYMHKFHIKDSSK